MSDSKVKQFAGTLKDVVTTVATTGKIMADADLVVKRRAICASCEHLLINRCQKCGCFISAKTALVAAVCPTRRW
jgi:hypothetical protein